MDDDIAARVRRRRAEEAARAEEAGNQADDARRASGSARAKKALGIDIDPKEWRPGLTYRWRFVGVDLTLHWDPPPDYTSSDMDSIFVTGRHESDRLFIRGQRTSFHIHSQEDLYELLVAKHIDGVHWWQRRRLRRAIAG